MSSGRPARIPHVEVCRASLVLLTRSSGELGLCTEGAVLSISIMQPITTSCKGGGWNGSSDKVHKSVIIGNV